MINNIATMFSDPNNRGMLDMMKQSNPNLNVDMMVSALKVVGKLATGYKAVQSAWSNVFVRLAVFGIVVLIIAYFFG